MGKVWPTLRAHRRCSARHRAETAFRSLLRRKDGASIGRHYALTTNIAQPTTRCCREVPFAAACRWRSSPVGCPTWRQTCGVRQCRFPPKGHPRQQGRQCPRPAPHGQPTTNGDGKTASHCHAHHHDGRKRPATTANAALAALSGILDQDRLPGYGERHLKRGRGFCPSSATRLADD